MAKRDGSKSAAIREYIEANPSAKPKEIYDALTSRGISVSMGLVSVVKYTKPKAGKRRGPRKRKAAAVGGMSAADLIAAKELSDSLGGIERTREALALLERLA
jgi:hypothetical protein